MLPKETRTKLLLLHDAGRLKLFGNIALVLVAHEVLSCAQRIARTGLPRVEFTLLRCCHTSAAQAKMSPVEHQASCGANGQFRHATAADEN